MPTKKKSGSGAWVDPDDAPRLTDRFFDHADVFEGRKLVRRGRPKVDQPKKAVSIRLSPEVLAHFRAGGEGWQTRINETLERAVARAARTRK
jgi:uncharacterized protein (DUF4415 family)